MKKNYNQGKTRTRFLVLMLLFCGMFANNAFAQQTFTWNGSIDNKWTTFDNWTITGIGSAASYPGANGVTNELVVISTSATNSCTLDVTPVNAINKLTVGSTTTPTQGILNVTASGGLTISGTFPIVISGGKLNNNGSGGINATSTTSLYVMGFAEPTNKTAPLDWGYAGTGALTLTQNNSAGDVVRILSTGTGVNGAGDIPVVALNSPTFNTTAGANTLFNFSVANSRGKFLGTFLKDNGSGAMTLFNLSAGVICEVLSGSSYELKTNNATTNFPIQMNGATLNNSGTIKLTGDYTGGVRLQGAADAINTLKNFTGATMNFTGGVAFASNAATTKTDNIINDGTLSITSNAAGFSINTASHVGTITNTGTMTVTSTSASIIRGFINNSGNLTFSNTIANSGTTTAITNQSTGVLTFTGATGVTAATGTLVSLANAGTIIGGPGIASANGNTFSGANTFTSGILSPGGASANGVLNIAGASTMSLSGTTLRINASGLTAGTGFDQINAITAGGGFNLSGATLDVTGLSGTSTPLDIVVANASGTLTGTFATVTGLAPSWSVAYTSGTGGKVQLVYTSSSPNITRSVASLSGFSTVNAVPSASQTFDAAGTNLLGNISINFNPSTTDYEMSTTSNFASTALPITLVPVGGDVSATPIYVRLKAGLSASTPTATIELTSASATAKTVTLSGTVVASFYYATSATSLSTLSNWGVNPDGSGANPSSLENANTNYYIKNGNATTDATLWTLGSGSKIIVGDPSAAAVELTIADGFTIAGGAIDVTAASSGSNSVVVKDATVVNGSNQSLYPLFGTLDPNSEVHYQKGSVYANGNPTYGKLFVDGLSTGTNIIGNPIIQTSLTVEAGASLSTTGNTAAYFYFPAGAKAIINGFAGTSKAAGLFDFNVATSTTNSGASLQFKDNLSSTLTLGDNSTAGFSRNNTSVQTISTLPAGVNYANLNVAWGTIPNPITVTGVLKVSSAVAVDLATNGKLTLKSTATRTAVVDKITNATITGNVIVERFIPAGHRAYRLLSSPTTGGTLNSNWQEGQTSGNTNPGFGTHLTGTGTGFDTTTTNASSIYSYNGAYAALTSTSGALNASDAYLVFVRGSRQASNLTAAVTNDATTLRTSGTLKTGDSSVSGLNATADGFSLVGNPYQAQVDMKAVLEAGTTTNLVTASYITVDPNFGTKGSYVTVDLATGLNNLSGSAANQYLQPGQACFVKTTTGTPTLQFIEDNKSVAVAQTSVFKTKQLANILRLNLYNTANTAQALDGILLTFDASESNDVNNSDSSKLTNFDESMATANSGKLLSIEKRANPITTDEIPLNITKYRGTSYTLKVQGMNLSETPYLVDAFTNTTTEVPVDGTLDYAFTVDATNASSAADRFKLIYAKTLKTIDNEVAGFVLYPNPSKSNSFNVVVPQSTTNASITVSNMLGQTLYSQNGIQAGSKSITVSNVKTAGVYLVSLTADGKTSTTKWIVE